MRSELISLKKKGVNVSCSMITFHIVIQLTMDIAIFYYMMVQNRLFKRLIHLVLKFLIFAKVMLLTSNLTNVLVIYYLNGLRLIKL